MRILLYFFIFLISNISHAQIEDSVIISKIKEHQIIMSLKNYEIFKEKYNILIKELIQKDSIINEKEKIISYNNFINDKYEENIRIFKSTIERNEKLIHTYQTLNNRQSFMLARYKDQCRGRIGFRTERSFWITSLLMVITFGIINANLSHY